MKKIHMMLIGLLGIMLSGAANAVDVDLAPSGNDITIVDCTKLANDIDIVLSSSVVGHFDCDTHATFIGVSVCHQFGMSASRSFSESTTSATVCTAMGGTLSGSTCTGTVTGSRFPSATTAQGTVASFYPGADCTAAEAKDVINGIMGSL